MAALQGEGAGPLDTALNDLAFAAEHTSGNSMTSFLLASQVANLCLTGAVTGNLVTATGWLFSNDTGSYGTNYLLRARKPSFTPAVSDLGSWVCIFPVSKTTKTYAHVQCNFLLLAMTASVAVRSSNVRCTFKTPGYM